MTDIEALHRAVAGHPGEDAPLLMLADAYREDGCEAAAAFAEFQAGMHRVAHDMAFAFDPVLKSLEDIGRRIRDQIRGQIAANPWGMR